MKNLALFVSFISCLGLLAACSDSSVSDSGADKIRPANIMTVSDPKDLLIRTFPGIVEAATLANLGFRVSGILVDLPASSLVGKNVNKGQLLAKLDSRDFIIDLQHAQAKYQLAKSKYERGKSLLESKFISKLDYEELLSAFQIAQSQLDRAKAELSDTKLLAPFDASIAAVGVKNHQSITVNETIIVLQNDDYFDVSFQVPEAIIASIPSSLIETYRQGTEEILDISVSFESNPGIQYPAYIKESQLFSDQATASFRIVVTFEKPSDIHLLPGMTAQVKVNLHQVNNAVLNPIVPLTAVFSAAGYPVKDEIKQVWKVDAETMKVSLHQVEIGRISSQGVEIIKGVSAGDKVVTAGVNFLVEGLEVKDSRRERGL